MKFRISGRGYVYGHITFIVIILNLVVSCSTPVERADEYASQDLWIKSVLEYRKAVADHPRDVEYRSRLKQTEQKAADYYYSRGMRYVEKKDYDAAIEQFQQGLVAMPDHQKLVQAINSALAHKEAASIYEQAIHSQDAGRRADAVRLLKHVLELNPDHKEASDALAKLESQAGKDTSAQTLILSTRTPITLNFRQTDLRTSFEFIAKSFGVSVIFDESIRTSPVTLFAKDVTFEQALNLLLATTKTFYKQIGPNTILIAPDTKDKRAQYEDQYVREFQLSSITAKEMADIIKGLVNVKKIIINEPLNAIVVRDTEDTIKLVQKIIDVNDRRSAELIMEVEILEVNRNKAERLGLDMGSYSVSAAVPGSTQIHVTGNVGESIRNAALLTLPPLTLNFYKQDVDAKILANPKIRVMSGKIAKIHIGDRIPLRSSSIIETTNQVRNTYDYKDIGIRLNVEPVVHVDNSVTVKVGLEVSALGENLGTQTEPAYRIGTRNAETFMTLRDGETAILGGLIRDEDRATRVRLPGLGDIPAVGSLFSSTDNSVGRTDILLTITPRIVRGWDTPAKGSLEFASGTEDHYMTDKLFGDLTSPGSSDLNGTAVDKATSDQPANPLPPVSPAQQNDTLQDKPLQNGQNGPDSNGDTNNQQTMSYSFSEPVYEGASGREFEVDLVANNLDKIVNQPVDVLFNSQLLTFVKAEAGGLSPSATMTADTDQTRGVLHLSLKYPETNPVSGSGVMAKLIFRAERTGTSYLVYRALSGTATSGESVTPQVKPSRVVIK